jgi:hypothetical protein
MEAVQTVRDLIRFSLVSSPITHARVYVSSTRAMFLLVIRFVWAGLKF